MTVTGTIVVGVDGSDHSKAALRWAVEEARLRNAKLKVICAWTYPYVAAAGSMLPVQTGWEEIRNDAQETLDRAIADVLDGENDPEVERLVVAGSAAHALTDAAADADLLVVGSRGHGGFTGLLLGSVGHQCVSHASCPVVVVRGRPAEPAPSAQAST